MRAGQIVEMGTRRNVFASPADPYTRALIAAVPIPELGRHVEASLDVPYRTLQTGQRRPACSRQFRRFCAEMISGLLRKGCKAGWQ